MKRILGIDQSLTGTGVVIMEYLGDVAALTEVLHAEVIQTSKWHEDWLVDAHRRSQHIASRIHELIEQYQPTDIVVERPSPSNKGSASITLPYLLGNILADIDKFSHVPASTLKKFATGNGRATKDEMVAVIESKDVDFHKMLMSTPKTKGRADLADAYHLCNFHYQTIKE